MHDGFTFHNWRHRLSRESICYWTHITYRKVINFPFIYNTCPNIFTFFRLLLEELVIYIEQCPKSSFATQWKNFVHKCPFPLKEAFMPKSWKQIYNMSSVNASLSRIQMVGYNEKIVSVSMNVVYTNKFRYK